MRLRRALIGGAAGDGLATRPAGFGRLALAAPAAAGVAASARSPALGGRRGRLGLGAAGRRGLAGGFSALRASVSDWAPATRLASFSVRALASSAGIWARTADSARSFIFEAIGRRTASFSKVMRAAASLGFIAS